MAKAKKQELSMEEKLIESLVPKDEQPYELPQNWCWVKFGCLAMEIADGPFGSNLKREHYTEKKEVRIIQLSNIGENGWKDENTKYTTFEHAKTISRSIVKPGEIVIAKMMPAGRAIKVPNEENAYILSSDAVKFVPMKFLYTDYLLYAINSNTFRNQVSSATQGITRARTSIGKMKTYAFPLAPIAEQQRIVNLIVSFFEKLDRAKELVQNVLDSFEERKSAILHEAYSGNLTTKWRKENGEDFRRENFEIRHLVTHLNQGWSPKCENYPSTGYEKWGVIKTTAIQHMEFIEEENKQLPDNLIPREKHELKLGDILITRAGPRIRVGVCCLINNVRPRLLLCDKAYRFRANIEQVIPEYLVLALNTPEILDEINSMKTGISESGVNLTQDGFMAIKLNIPPIKEQVEIVRIVEGLLENEQKANDLCDVIEKIDLMKESILARAFRGELSTNNPDEESALELLKGILREEVTV